MKEKKQRLKGEECENKEAYILYVELSVTQAKMFLPGNNYKTHLYA